MIMVENILFVDDDEGILNAAERVFAESGMKVLRATNGRDALELCRDEEIAVVVSDNMMPGMRGVELLSRVRDVSPHTVKILMTAYADLSTALAAINSGEVFRFVVKPWENDALLELVRHGLGRYNTLKALSRGDEAVMRGLAQTIELKDPYTRGHCERVAFYAVMMADALGLSDETKKEIRYGGWLHDCGKIGVPEAILNYSGVLGLSEFETIKKHPLWGADVARESGLPETVVNIIRHHHERYDGQGYPAGKRGNDIPLEARIVSVADVFDALTSDRPYRKAYHWEKGLRILSDMKGNALDPLLVSVFCEAVLKLREQESTSPNKEMTDDRV